MAWKKICTYTEVVYPQPSRRALVISAGVRNISDKFECHVYCREDDKVQERDKALIKLIFPDGATWHGTAEELQNKLK